MYNTIKINAGDGGWGGPLTVTPTEKCHTVLSVTGGGIHPVAQKLADLTGGVAVDGWKTNLPDDEIMIAVVDCGGTARCGVYPKKGIFTVNLMPVGQSGPLAQFITPDIYVSSVREQDIEVIGEAAAVAAPEPEAAPAEAAEEATLVMLSVNFSRLDVRPSKWSSRTSFRSWLSPVHCLVSSAPAVWVT